MSGEIDVTNPDKPKRILIVIANPATSTTLGIPVGFWGSAAGLRTLTAEPSLDETVEMLGRGSLDVILEVSGYGRLFVRSP
jgi:hypothetical protein